MDLKYRLNAIRSTLPQGVELVAVSKFHPVEAIVEAYEAGQRIFGENRVQELESKVPLLPKDIHWHMIGTLQRNKVKYIVPYIDTIQSVDSLRLLQEIERQCILKGRDSLNVLLQVHISGEPTKQGFTKEELYTLLDSGILSQLQHVRVTGLMAMAALTEDMLLVEQQFAEMQTLLADVKQKYFAAQPYFRELSIGMSKDYRIAIRHGATFVRIGTNIFGEREY